MQLGKITIPSNEVNHVIKVKIKTFLNKKFLSKAFGSLFQCKKDLPALKFLKIRAIYTLAISQVYGAAPRFFVTQIVI